MKKEIKYTCPKCLGINGCMCALKPLPKEEAYGLRWSFRIWKWGIEIWEKGFIEV